MSKPIIETIINTSALALTSYGILQITTMNNYWGYLALISGMFFEFIKYYGRKIDLW